MGYHKDKQKALLIFHQKGGREVVVYRDCIVNTPDTHILRGLCMKGELWNLYTAYCAHGRGFYP
jgi:hypothetical protein